MNLNFYSVITRFMGIFRVICAISIVGVIVSCNKKELAIQQNFPFEVSVMPVPKEVAKDQIVEIRIEIKTSENFSNAQHFIRYFQFDGTGTLQYWGELPYNPNDLYPLPAKVFRLYYTSTSSVSQSFEVWISDNFGNEKDLSFEFNSSE